jgi:hypothetical protein
MCSAPSDMERGEDMSEIVCLNCYPDTKAKVKMLNDCINATPGEYDICVSSHWPIPVATQRSINFVAYDSNDPLVEMDIPMYYASNEFKCVYSIKSKYHGLAIYRNLFNVVNLLSRSYDVLHMIEADNNPQTIPDYLNLAKEVDWNSFKSAGFGWAGAPGRIDGVTGAIYSVNLKGLVLPDFRTWEEMTVFMGDSSPMYEILIRKLFSPVSYLEPIAIENRNTTLPASQVVFCRMDDSQVIMFHINVYGTTIEVEYWLGGVKYNDIIPPVGYSWRTITKDTLYNGKPIIVDPDNHYRFVDGQIPSPIWTPEDERRVG